MSSYQFTPAYSFNRGEHSHVVWRNGFTDQQLADIIKIGETKDNFGKATVGLGFDNENIRRSNTSWLNYQDCAWLYDHLAWIVQQLNGQFYGYDLWGFCEDMQYTVYESDTKGFYDWHQDSMGNSIENNIDKRTPRKFSISLLLSDPNEYEGGDLIIKSGTNDIVAPRERGIVTAFPSFQTHKVTPVTSGVRKSLVVWVTGPAFK
jgi:PKHD-type hydroxylase